MKPIDVKSSTHINFEVENNYKGHKFKVGDHVRISKQKSIFAKVTLPIRQSMFLIKKVGNIVPLTYVIEGINGEKLLERFMKKRCKMQIKQVPELKKR